MPLIAWLAVAHATPLVWLGEPLDAEEMRARGLVGVDQTLSLAELAGIAHDDDAIDAAYQRLEQTLQSVRNYETKLDGELIIMADLQAAIEAIPAVRSPADREALFKALAYQGFAIDRYFADTLATDPTGKPWRVELDSVATVRPWADAAALHPDRTVSAYDISEAPQRVAYDAVHDRSADVLPGGLRVELPADHVLRLDGVVRPTEGTVLRVPPGLHYVQVEADDQVLHTDRVQLGSGDAVPLSVDLTVDGLATFLRTASPETGVPTHIGDLASAVGGTFWTARRNDDTVEVIAIAPSGVSFVPLVPPVPEKPDRADQDGLSAGLTLAAGWFASGDFYTSQHDEAPNTAATVNSAGLAVGGDISFDRGVFRASIGLDAITTPGPFHVARSGTTAYRVRPVPHVFLGTRYGGITAGLLLPYHPIVGGRLSVPLVDGLAWTTDGQVGLPGSLQRADGSTYDTLPVYTARTGLTLRFRP